MKLPGWRKFATALFLAAVLALLVFAARRIPWPQVGEALQTADRGFLLAAVLIAAAGHAVVAAFDLWGRRFTAHGLAVRTTLAIAAVSYAINQNLGYLVGGLALRLRLYARHGVPLTTGAAVVATSVLTNWIGHFALFGVVLVVEPQLVPDEWPLGQGAARAVGVLALALVVGYLAACALLRQRHWEWRQLKLDLPPGPVALAQLGSGMAAWALMGGVVWAGLHAVAPQAALSYPLVTACLLLAAIAGALAHVPAGMGVIEAVFVAMLGDRVPVPTLIAGLLVYRAAYQWLPGLLAGVALPFLDRGGHPDEPSLPTPRPAHG